MVQNHDVGEPWADESVLLHRKLQWVTFFRLIVVTVLLTATAILTFTESDSLVSEAQVYLYGAAFAVYLVSVCYLVAMRWGPNAWLLGLAYLQVFGDVALAAFLVWLTGGGESIFSFLFSLGIINAAILLYRKGALIAAVASALVFAALTLGLQWGVFAPAVSFMAPQIFPLPRLVFVLFMNAAGFVLVAILASYISEQERRAGKQLSQAEEGLAALVAVHERIVQSVGSGIFTLDHRGRVTFVNRAGEDLLSSSERDLRGRLLDDVLPELADAVRRRETGGSVAPRGEVAVCREGEVRQIGFTVNDLASVGEDPGGSVVVFQDLTDLRRIEDQARRNERLAAVGALAAGLAHEIRNPLASMSGSVEILRSELSTNARQDRLMDIVLRETDRLNRLLADFLSFARPAPPRLGAVSLRKVVHEIREILLNDPVSEACELDVRIQEDVFVQGDEGQLRRALLNLLLNAAQAVEGKGSIRIILERHEDRLRLSIIDDGPGISDDRLERIFDPFYTTRDRGSGLGLSLVHSTVEAHGGHVEVSSEVGKGSRFTVVLPMLEAQHESSVSAGS